MAQPLPVFEIVVVHRRPPAEDIMADKKPRHHKDSNRQKGNLSKSDKIGIEIGSRHRDFGIRVERVLHCIKERPPPVVDGNRNLNAEIGGKQNKR